MTNASETISNQAPTFSIVLSILLIICGALAILLPVGTSFGVLLVISWLLVISGVVQFVHAFGCSGAGHILWKLTVAFIYFVTGLYLLVHPGLGVLALTLALAIFFTAEGVVDIATYFGTRKDGVPGWLLLDGVITLILGLMMWSRWPVGSLWAVGTLTGISMIMTGITRLMLTRAARREQAPPAAAKAA